MVSPRLDYAWEGGWARANRPRPPKWMMLSDASMMQRDSSKQLRRCRILTRAKPRFITQRDFFVLPRDDRAKLTVNSHWLHTHGRSSGTVSRAGVRGSPCWMPHYRLAQYRKGSRWAGFFSTIRLTLFFLASVSWCEEFSDAPAFERDRHMRSGARPEARKPD